MSFLDECNCDCHTSPFDVSHIMACCASCNICSSNIVMWSFDQHYKECLAERVSFIEKRLARKLTEEEKKNLFHE